MKQINSSLPRGGRWEGKPPGQRPPGTSRTAEEPKGWNQGDGGATSPLRGTPPMNTNGAVYWLEQLWETNDTFPNNKLPDLQSSRCQPWMEGNVVQTRALFRESWGGDQIRGWKTWAGWQKAAGTGTDPG